MAPPPWYKWVILFTTCLSTFFAYGYAGASTSIATVYYIQHYNERIISSIISSINYGVVGMSCLPSLYLSKKIGNRIQQVIGGILMSAAIALTSFTTVSWQGLLLSGVAAGIGGGMMQIATTNTIKEYFPGRQIGPFGAVSLTLNSASIAVPQLWTSLMEILGWEKALLTIDNTGACSFFDFSGAQVYSWPVIDRSYVSQLLQVTATYYPEFQIPL